MFTMYVVLLWRRNELYDAYQMWNVSKINFQLTINTNLIEIE